MAGTAGSSNVWVGGLPEGMDDDTFRGLFAEYGSVVSCKVFPDKWYGFVNFETPEEAEAVVALLDGADCGGRTLKVKLHSPGAGTKDGGKGGKDGGWGKAQGKGKGSWSAPYGKGAAAEMLASLMGGWKATKGGAGEKEAWPALDPTAMLASIGKNPSMGKGSKGASSGGGLADPAMAGACSTSQDGLLVGRSPDYTSGDGDSNLYIEALPYEADQLYLYKIFAPFGSILSTFTKETSKGKIGFVTYQNALEAQYAIQRLNGAVQSTGEELRVRVQNKKADAKGKEKGAGKW